MFHLRSFWNHNFFSLNFFTWLHIQYRARKIREWTHWKFLPKTSDLPSIKIFKIWKKYLSVAITLQRSYIFFSNFSSPHQNTNEGEFFFCPTKAEAAKAAIAQVLNLYSSELAWLQNQVCSSMLHLFIDYWRHLTKTKKKLTLESFSLSLSLSFVYFELKLMWHCWLSDHFFHENRRTRKSVTTELTSLSKQTDSARWF